MFISVDYKLHQVLVVYSIKLMRNDDRKMMIWKTKSKTPHHALENVLQ